ncbi:hypothetical protein C7C45_04900 [Micromonospora arborensis]|uniref:Uncharacterized protein n=1 Tax=Micromonospora arborensis TaxID=2116518 RepID=A0A318NV96_9ACTN|nr:hypothetical protein [Micromonospora arborensis]PYC75209.1 hypothetical protein C7C45_04900 [Micromonospora arborensis]
MIKDERVRYSPELGVWTVDMSGMTAVSPAQGERILGWAMFQAREAGAALEDCTCDPLDQFWDGPNRRVPTAPHAHTVVQARGADSRLMVIGHGGRARVAAMTGQEHQGHQCPLQNVDGEHRAKELVEHGGLTELWGLTVAFPTGAGPLQPLADGEQAPKLWEAEPVSFNAAGLHVSLPGRHVHPAVQPSLAAYRDLSLKATELDRAAREAQDRAQNAPQDLRRAAAQAAASGQATNTAKAAQAIRDLELEAQAAKAVAQGTEDALEATRAAVLKAVEDNRAEWLAYLSGQGRAALGRLDAAVAALDAALGDLVAVDAMRANVEKPLHARQVFAQGSALTGQVNASRAATRAAREKVAETLAPLSRYATEPEPKAARKMKAAA